MDAVIVMYIASAVVVLLGLSGVYANSITPVPKEVPATQDDEVLFFLDEDEIEDDEPTGIFLRIPKSAEEWNQLNRRPLQSSSDESA